MVKRWFWQFLFQFCNQKMEEFSRHCLKFVQLSSALFVFFVFCFLAKYGSWQGLCDVVGCWALGPQEAKDHWLVMDWLVNQKALTLRQNQNITMDLKLRWFESLENPKILQITCPICHSLWNLPLNKTLPLLHTPYVPYRYPSLFVYDKSGD